MILSAFTELHNHSFYLILDYFHHLQMKPIVISDPSPLLHPPKLRSNNFRSVFSLCGLIYPRHFTEMTHAIFVLLCLNSFILFLFSVPSLSPRPPNEARLKLKTEDVHVLLVFSHPPPECCCAPPCLDVDFFYLAECFQYLSTFQCTSALHSFLALDNIYSMMVPWSSAGITDKEHNNLKDK